MRVICNYSIFASETIAVVESKKVNPFDVEGLEKSLNDSATRVSTIWISFLVFSLYLLIATTTVEHRQLLLAEPVKLPALNIDLPIWGFFVLAPILFVIFHVYVLLQVLLLSRTAVSYNEALDRAVRSPSANAAMRQRLANTLFAQIFAGSPRERDGWLGWLLKGMAWITLVIAPILILFAFQIAFLPYHSHLATWIHRALIFAELAAAFLLWPLALDARRDFDWAKLKHGLKRSMSSPKPWAFFLLWPLVPRRRWGLDWPSYQQQRQFRYLVRGSTLAIVGTLFFCCSLLFATFPGEAHVNLINWQPLGSVNCDRWMSRKFDRIDVTRIILVDGKELSRIEKDISERGLKTHEGERIRTLRDRNLNCAIFANADARYVDFSSASMIGAVLDSTSLQGTTFASSQMKGASLRNAKLQGSDLTGAELQEAVLSSALLQGAVIDNAKLPGANLDSAQLQGASLTRSNLRGASLNGALLHGADLARSQLEGASLNNAQLQGASLHNTQLQGASLIGAWLMGADLTDSSMGSALMSGVHVWRARNAKCEGARVARHLSNKDIKPAFVLLDFASGSIEATRPNIEKFIQDAVIGIRDPAAQKATRERMTEALTSAPNDDDTASQKIWDKCATEAAQLKPAVFNESRTQLIVELICGSGEYGRSVVQGIVRTSVTRSILSIFRFIMNDSTSEDRDSAVHLLQALTAQTKNGCYVLRNLDRRTQQRIRTAGTSKNSTPAQGPGDLLDFVLDR